MKKKRILLINGNGLELVLIQNLLDQLSSDYLLDTVSNGKDALNTLMGSYSDTGNHPRTRKVKPDIILLDQNLSDMTGYEFLEIVRKYYSLKHIRIFILTAPLEALPPAFNKL